MNKLLTAFLLCNVSAIGQNLVPNPGFESYTSCPTFASQLDRAAPWYNPTQGTPEYYNGCSPVASYASVPVNLIGGYQPARSGQGYIGLYVYSSFVANFREYAEAPLSTPLEAGQCYYFEMYVNLHNSFRYASDGIGAYFSTGPVGSAGITVLPYAPQVSNTTGNVLSDTLGWSKVSGYFTAAGGENFITIGNFKTDAASGITDVNPTAVYANEGYVLIEDVLLMVAENPELNLGNDTTICAGSTLSLNATIPGATYLWQDGSTVPVYEVTEAGTYWVTASLGNCTVSDTLTVLSATIPSPESMDTVLCTGETLIVDVSQPSVSCLWDNGSTEPVRTITDAGIYWVTLTGYCGSITDTFHVAIEKCYCSAYVPNAFTPGSDGINDGFGPVVSCSSLEDFSFRVFNRWGETVFTSNDPGLQWNGRYKGLRCLPGVYTWELIYSGKEDGQTEHAVKHGMVTVLH